MANSLAHTKWVCKYHMWKKDLESENHIPPRNMETLMVISTVPEKFNQIIADKAVRKDYESLKAVVSKPLYGVSPVTIKWEAKDQWEISEMEKAEIKLFKGWHPK